MGSGPRCHAAACGLLLLFLYFEWVKGEPVTLAGLLDSAACNLLRLGPGNGSIVCNVASGTVVLLSGLPFPLSQQLSLVGSPTHPPAGSVVVSVPVFGGSTPAAVLGPASPLVIAPTGSLTLHRVTVHGISFSDSPLKPALSLAWSGITLLPGARLIVTSSVLKLDCPTWTSLHSAICDFGHAPGDSQVRECRVVCVVDLVDHHAVHNRITGIAGMQQGGGQEVGFRVRDPSVHAALGTGTGMRLTPHFSAQPITACRQRLGALHAPSASLACRRHDEDPHP